MQRAAEQAISSQLPSGSGLPSASLVAIDNKTGEVRAMVGGPVVNGEEDYAHFPFNLATEGHRQPGSAFKPFTLAEALKTGDYGPDSVIASAPQDFIVPNSAGKEHFIVHNFGNTYSGSLSLRDATAYSDNTVYAQVGIHVGVKRIAHLAAQMGIRSPISKNYAMILGGLHEGVSPLDMAHAYETFAAGGNRVFNPLLGAPNEGPTGIAELQCYAVKCDGKTDITDHPTYKRILPTSVAAEVHDILTGPVAFGTATNAAIPGVDVVGKTGTTSDYADAWFVGWTPQMTTAVWVGYPTSSKSMATAYNGGPVEGGTYPAVIWQSFMTQALQILANEAAKHPHGKKNTSGNTGNTGNTGVGSTGSVPSVSGAGSNGGGTAGNTGGGGTAGNTGGGGAAGNTGGGGGGGGGGGATGNSGGGGGGGGGGGATGNSAAAVAAPAAVAAAVAVAAAGPAALESASAARRNQLPAPRSHQRLDADSTRARCVCTGCGPQRGRVTIQRALVVGGPSGALGRWKTAHRGGATLGRAESPGSWRLRFLSAPGQAPTPRPITTRAGVRPALSRTISRTPGTGDRRGSSSWSSALEAAPNRFVLDHRAMGVRH